MLYAVIDSTQSSLEDKLVGYHEKKKVVGQYYYSIKNGSNGSKYKFVKCKPKVIKSISNYYDYHLVRFGKNYIPSMYYECAKEDLQTVVCEYKLAGEILERIFEYEKLGSHDRHIIEEAIFIIQDCLEREMDCVIPPDSFKELNAMYQSYKTEMIWSEPITEDEWIPFSDLDNDKSETINK